MKWIITHPLAVQFNLLHPMHTPELMHVSGCLSDFTNPVGGLRTTPKKNQGEALSGLPHTFILPLRVDFFCAEVFFHRLLPAVFSPESSSVFKFVSKLWQERYYGANGIVEANWKCLLFWFSCLNKPFTPWLLIFSPLMAEGTSKLFLGVPRLHLHWYPQSNKFIYKAKIIFKSIFLAFVAPTEAPKVKIQISFFCCCK